MSNKPEVVAPKSFISYFCSNATISITLYLIFSLHFFAFVTEFLWEYYYSMPFIIASYVILTCVLSFAMYYTVSIDPVDDAVTCKDLNKAPEYGVKISYCHACKVDVHSSSRHCRYCDKCVIGFDHHCSWLNVCVGAKNYYYFMLTCSTLTIAISASLGLCIAYVIEFLLSPRGHFYQRYNTSVLRYVLNFQAALAILVVSIFVLLPFAISLYHIMSFHALLAYRGMTTYDYVVEKHRQARKELTAASKAKRLSGSSEAGTMKMQEIGPSSGQAA